LRKVADEDARLAVRVIEVRFAIWAVEEGRYELASGFGVRGYWDLEAIDYWGLERSDLAD
jgi:hypothetical protein